MLKISGRATVFGVDEKSKYVDARLSTGRKEKRGAASGLAGKMSGDNFWVNSSWFGRFIGAAFEKAAGSLSDKDRIEITDGWISLEPYVDTNGTTVYPKAPRVIVTDFEFVDATPRQSSEQESNIPLYVAADDEDPNSIPF